MMVRLAACMFAAAPLFAQGIQIGKASPDLRFEVVSLKPGDPNPAPGSRSGLRPDAGGERYEAWNCPIRTMIEAAYRLKPEQVVGGPSWLDSDRYDMVGKAEKSSTGDELHVMLMNMLVDRLQLKFHHEKKDMARYVLTAAKGEPKLTPHAAGNGGDPWIDQTIEGFLHVKLKATYCPIDYFAFRLGLILDRPVVDETGLKGSYKVPIELTMADMMRVAKAAGMMPAMGGPAPAAPTNANPADAASDPTPSMFAAVQKLGLKLDSKKAPVDTVIVVHLDKTPTEN